MNDLTDTALLRSVVFQLEAQDLVHAHRLHFRQYTKSRPGLTRLAVVSALGILVYGALMGSILPWDQALWSLLAFIVVVPIGAVGLPFLIVHATSRSVARRTLRQQKTLHQPMQLTWSDDGMLMSNNFGEARMQWTDYRKIRHDRHVILLYESDRLYRMIPTRALSAAQSADLEACMASAGVAAR
jgi:hypothetical protein